VLHFAVPLQAPGVKVLDTWRTMGMRASGSNDIMLDGLFVPDSAVSSHRPKGVWALQKVARKRDDADVWYLVGELENALVTGQMAVQGMIDLCADYTFVPDIATANAFFIRKTIASDVEKALETVGGGGIFRSMGLERLVRDMHAGLEGPGDRRRGVFEGPIQPAW
jgi:hypothetical protein